MTHAHAHAHTHTHIHTQVAELQNLASDARTAREEREAKQDALDKLAAARSKVTALEEQLEQLHVLRGSDEANAKEAAVQQVHDKLAERDAEIQRLLQQLDLQPCHHLPAQCHARCHRRLRLAHGALEPLLGRLYVWYVCMTDSDGERTRSRAGAAIRDICPDGTAFCVCV